MVIKEYNYSEGAGGAGGGGLSELPWQPTVASTISDTGCDVQETGGGGGRRFCFKWNDAVVWKGQTHSCTDVVAEGRTGRSNVGFITLSQKTEPV